ncbi:hypothetical protein JCM10207_007852 [Rhodosporidiobolus poonsookiae]
MSFPPGGLPPAPHFQKTSRDSSRSPSPAPRPDDYDQPFTLPRPQQTTGQYSSAGMQQYGAAAAPQPAAWAGGAAPGAAAAGFFAGDDDSDTDDDSLFGSVPAFSAAAAASTSRARPAPAAADSSSGEEDDDDDAESSEEETLAQARSRLRRKGRARKMQGVPGLFADEAVLPDEEFGSKTVLEIYHMVKKGVINLDPAYQRQVVPPAPPSSSASGAPSSSTAAAGYPYASTSSEEDSDDDGDEGRGPRTHRCFAWLDKDDEQVEPRGTARAPAWLTEGGVGGKGKGKAKKRQRSAEGRHVREVWNCMDGKQRMTAVCKFIDGEVDLLPEKASLHRKKTSFALLPQEAKDQFLAKRFRYGFYRDLDEAQERLVFERVQLGRSLDKGEILNAIAGAYADWVRTEVQMRYFTTNDKRSFKPRLLEVKRGAELVAAYMCSRNLLLSLSGDFSDMTTETDSKRKTRLASDDLPSGTERARVAALLDRFQRLTLVAPLKGEDVWPKGKVGDACTAEGIAVPHRVWRIMRKRLGEEAVKKIRAKAKPKKAKKDSGAKGKGKGKGKDKVPKAEEESDDDDDDKDKDVEVDLEHVYTLSPVEMHFLPTLVHRFAKYCDGDLLEIVERVRVHLLGMYAGEMKDNSKLYDAFKAWVNNFDPDTLQHRYRNDGTRRSKAERRTLDPAELRPPPDAAALYDTSSNAGADAGASEKSKGKKRAQEADFPPPVASKKKKVAPAAAPAAAAAAQHPRSTTPAMTPGPTSAAFLPAAAAGHMPPPPAPAPQPVASTSRVRQTPAPPPPPPAPAGLSLKQQRFAQLTNMAGALAAPAPPQRAPTQQQQQRGAIAALPSSKKRPQDAPMRDERGKLIYPDATPAPAAPAAGAGAMGFDAYGSAMAAMELEGQGEYGAFGGAGGGYDSYNGYNGAGAAAAPSYNPQDDEVRSMLGVSRPALFNPPSTVEPESRSQTGVDDDGVRIKPEPGEDQLPAESGVEQQRRAQQAQLAQEEEEERRRLETQQLLRRDGGGGGGRRSREGSRFPDERDRERNGGGWYGDDRGGGGGGGGYGGYDRNRVRDRDRYDSPGPSRGYRSESARPAGRERDGGRFRVLVSGMTAGTSWQDLKDWARSVVRNVLNARIDSNDPTKGLLDFSSARDARDAVEQLESRRLGDVRVRLVYDGEVGPPPPRRYNDYDDREPHRREGSSRPYDHRDGYGGGGGRPRSRSRSRERERDRGGFGGGYEAFRASQAPSAAASASNGLPPRPSFSTSGGDCQQNAASTYGQRGNALADQNDLRPLEATRDPRKRG